MPNDLLDILSRNELPITNEQLINYLSGKMSNQERHDIEKIILDSGIDHDAMEGLHMISNKEKLQQYQLEINKALREKLQQKNKPRKRKKTLHLNTPLIMTGALLAFIILLWLIFHLLRGGK